MSRAINGPSRHPTAHSHLPKPTPIVIMIPAIGLLAKHTCNIDWHLQGWNFSLSLFGEKAAWMMNWWTYLSHAPQNRVQCLGCEPWGGIWLRPQEIAADSEFANNMPPIEEQYLFINLCQVKLWITTFLRAKSRSPPVFLSPLYLLCTEKVVWVEFTPVACML